MKDDDDDVLQHHTDDFGEKLKGFFTEGLVRVPTSFLVERVLAPLYPETDCGPGRYRDPGTDSCVFMCREGYVSVCALSGLLAHKTSFSLLQPFARESVSLNSLTLTRRPLHTRQRRTSTLQHRHGTRRPNRASSS